MTLHIVNRSPTQSDALDSCIRRAQPGNAILLIEDAIYALLILEQLFSKHQKLSQLEIYALAEDVTARGASQWCTEQIRLVDYQGFVALTEHYPSSLSWY